MTRRLAVVVALLCFCAAARRGREAPGLHPRRARPRRRVLPARRQRRLRRPATTTSTSTYDAATDQLTGVARIQARATQNLSRFNLDLDGAHGPVGHRSNAALRRDGAAHDGELTITPRQGHAQTTRCFTVTDRLRRRARDAARHVSGFLHTDDGALAVGQPHGASYVVSRSTTTSPTRRPTRSRSRCPQGIEAISNGRAPKRCDRAGAARPLDVGGPRADGLLPRDAGDRRLRRPRLPRGRALRSGTPSTRACSSRSPRAPASTTRYSQSADLAYKRLAAHDHRSGGRRRVDLLRHARHRAHVGLLLRRGAPSRHRRLDDAAGREREHVTRTTGNVCPYWLGLHPFLEHYQTATDEGCDPEGTTGEWHAASGSSGGYEEWTIDLSALRGRDDRTVAQLRQRRRRWHYPGVFVDDIAASRRRGLDVVRGRRRHARRLDGARARRRAASRIPNDWTVGTVEIAPGAARPGDRRVAARSKPEVLDFLSASSGAIRSGPRAGSSTSRRSASR